MIDNSSLFSNAQPPGPKTKSSVALQRLKHALLTCEIKPGAIFAEAEIEAHYRLSRAGVRAALASLAAHGLVTPQPRQGWRAAPITGAVIGDLISVRRQLEPTLAKRVLSDKDIEQLNALVMLHTALAERDDAQARVTARVTDRQILNVLAGGAGLFLRRWLTEMWDHTSRVVHFLDGGGAHYRPLSREPLIAALKARTSKAAAKELERDIAYFETFVADALLQLPVQLGGGVEQLSARSRKKRATAPFPNASNCAQHRGCAPLIQGRTRHAWDKN
jgi:DNA-binding GntR family transcriptional regulator